MGEECLMSFRDPLTGPGPSGPADLGIPVSATVGAAVGIFTVGSVGSGDMTGVREAAVVGIGAGAWFKTAGFKGGEALPWGGGEALLVVGKADVIAMGDTLAGGMAEGGGPFEL